MADYVRQAQCKPVKILIIGNGFGGIYTLRNLHKFFHGEKMGRKIELALVGKKNYFLFTPLLHEVATGGINESNIVEPIRKVLGCCLDKFYMGQADTVNIKNKTVSVLDVFVNYDYLVLATGSETNFYDTPGAEQYSFTLKSIEDAIKIKNHCIAQIERASRMDDQEERRKALRFVVVGGGPTGVELAAELEELVKETFAAYYKKEIIEDVSIILVQKNLDLVPQFGKQMRKKSLEVLTKKGIEVRLGSSVLEVSPSKIILDKNEMIFTENVFWVAGIKPVVPGFDEDVEKSPNGRLIVNEYLQLENYPEIFALGDAIMAKNPDGSPVPALAQAAEKEAYAVAKNLYLLLNGRSPEKFSYKSSGNLLSLGQWMAAGEILNFTFSGRFTWWVWRTVYLSKLISWRKKVRVAADWTMNIFSARDISEI